MTDPTEAMTETAKAVGQVAKTAEKAIDAGRQAGGWIDRIFGRALEDAVALHWSDRLRARRIAAAIFDRARLVELFHKTEAELKAKGIDTTRLIPPKVAIPLIENATMEDDDDLHSLWAKLLANAINPSANVVEKKFVTTLSELTSRDANLLKILCTKWKAIDKTKLTNDSTIKYGPGVDAGEDHGEISIINLSRLGLIAPAFTEFTTYSPPGHDDRYGDYGKSGDPVRAYGDLSVVTVRPFGEAFYEAVSS